MHTKTFSVPRNKRTRQSIIIISMIHLSLTVFLIQNEHHFIVLHKVLNAQSMQIRSQQKATNHMSHFWSMQFIDI